KPNPINPASIIRAFSVVTQTCHSERSVEALCLRQSAFAPQPRLRQNAMMPTETQLPEVRQSSVQNTIFALLCGGFIVNGIVITFIPPILPIFMAKGGLDARRAGLFSLVQFSASLVGVLISSALVTTKGFKPAIVLGLAMLGTGFALLNAPTFPLALLASGL